MRPHETSCPPPRPTSSHTPQDNPDLTPIPPGSPGVCSEWREGGWGGPARPRPGGARHGRARAVSQDKPDWGSAGGNMLLFVEAPPGLSAPVT